MTEENKDIIIPETMKVTVPEKGQDDTVEIEWFDDKGINFEGPLGRGRLPPSIADTLAKTIQYFVYAVSAGSLFYMVCKGLELLWHQR